MERFVVLGAEHLFLSEFKLDVVSQQAI